MQPWIYNTPHLTCLSCDRDAHMFYSCVHRTVHAYANAHVLVDEKKIGRPGTQLQDVRHKGGQICWCKQQRQSDSRPKKCASSKQCNRTEYTQATGTRNVVPTKTAV